MKTAIKLAQIAKANQQGMFNLIKNGKVFHTGSYEDCSNLAYNLGGTFTIEKVKEVDPYEAFQKKVRWGSHQYVRYVIKRCKELASKGYGGVLIKIDITTDMSDVDKGKKSCYSHDFVVKLLRQKGFALFTTPEGDYYDAQEYTLFWLYDLPLAPDSEKIGMCWE